MQRLIPQKHLPIALLLITALAIGVLTAGQYGASWDEGHSHRYGDYAIHAYRYFFHPQDLPAFGTILDLYGPSYFMVANFVADFLLVLYPPWSLTVAWHFVYFVTFLIGALALYLLSMRWLSPASAFGMTLLFISQPLLWGHAFINPKDTPFMAMFTVSVYLGVQMTEHYGSSWRGKASLVLAAVLLGALCAFRVVGPLAGLIVLAYAAKKLGAKAIPMATQYLAVAILTGYVAWPYLWAAPVGRFVESLRTMSTFPTTLQMLFASQVYSATNPPLGYFPTLLCLQLTEPALVLLGCGLILSALSLREKGNWEPLALFGLWFVIPVAIIVLTHRPIYDNARQLLFVMPPLFLLMGLALEKLFSRIARSPARAAVLLLAALPGVVAAIGLHPYEYVYYNSLAGGTRGAFRHYETDYWATSFKDIASYINGNGSPGAKVLVYGPVDVLKRYVRPDIRVYKATKEAKIAYRYIVVLTRLNWDLRVCPQAKTIYAVGRQGAVFSVLKEKPPDTVCH